MEPNSLETRRQMLNAEECLPREETIEQHARGLHKWTYSTSIATSCKINELLLENGVGRRFKDQEEEEDHDRSKTVYLDNWRSEQFLRAQKQLLSNIFDYQTSHDRRSTWSATSVNPSCSEELFKMLKYNIDSKDNFALMLLEHDMLKQTEATSSSTHTLTAEDPCDGGGQKATGHAGRNEQAWETRTRIIR